MGKKANCFFLEKNPTQNKHKHNAYEYVLPWNSDHKKPVLMWVLPATELVCYPAENGVVNHGISVISGLQTSLFHAGKTHIWTSFGHAES